MLQQYLPFTVLKPQEISPRRGNFRSQLQQYLPFTVLKLWNLSCLLKSNGCRLQQYLPFTVLKQNSEFCFWCSAFIIELQQYLPFTVLKHIELEKQRIRNRQQLQQYLPFTVLKLYKFAIAFKPNCVATVLTVYGIETGRSNHYQIYH